MSFPYQIVQYLGGGSGEMGTLLTLQGLMDIPAMVLFSLLLRRAASWRWVRLAGLSFFLHALLTWLAPSVFFLYGIQIFETTGYALYAVASVYWVNDMTSARRPGPRANLFYHGQYPGHRSEQFSGRLSLGCRPAPDPPWPFPL